MSVAPSSYSRRLTAFILRFLARRILRRPLTLRSAEVRLRADPVGASDADLARTS